MWGDMMPKRGQLDFMSRISRDTLELLATKVDHMFIMVSFPYACLDWRGYLNILFTPYETPTDRVDISFFFKLI
jgi:hypothetical protein